MKRLIALLFCLLMLFAVTACKSNNGGADVPTQGVVDTVPVAEDASGSVFIGSWHITAQVSPLDKLTFHEKGTLQADFDGHTLGGVFFDDGSKLTLHISQQTLEGTYTVNGDTITLVTESDTLVFTKIK